MKVGQTHIGRWVCKLVTKSTVRTEAKQSAKSLHVLDAEQLRQVSGGSGGSTQGPRTGW
jgi:hypothetical protein